MRIGADVALGLAGATARDLSVIDLYSRFPSAVQIGSEALGLPLETQLTQTGGLPFAGGPWNNYVMHERGGRAEKAIAACRLPDGRRAWDISWSP